MSTLNFKVAVGNRVTPVPPHRSRRAAFPQRAPPESLTVTGVRGLGGPSSSGPGAWPSVDRRIPVQGPEPVSRHTHPPRWGPSLHVLRRQVTPALFGRFPGSMTPSDSSLLPRRLRLLGFPLWPRTAAAAVGGTRPPRFRRGPFVRDMVSDSGRATEPRITVPHMVPSTFSTVSASATSGLSKLNTYPTRLLCTLRSRRHRTATQHSLPGARYGLPGPDFHRLDRASFAWRTENFFSAICMIISL